MKQPMHSHTHAIRSFCCANPARFAVQSLLGLPCNARSFCRAACSRAFAMGPFGSRIKKENFRSSGVPVLRGKNLGGNRFDDSDVVFVDEDKAEELAASIARPGDLVFTHRGTLGQVALVPRRPRYPLYLVSQSQMKATIDEERVLPEYVYYWFCSPEGQHALLRNTSQTGVPAISQPLTSLQAIAIPVPPLSEQRAIAEVLGALDDKIEANNRQVAVVWSIVRSLYVSATLDAALAPLGELVQLAYGKGLPASKRVGGSIPVFGSGGIAGWHDQPLVPGPGVVVGRKGTIGSVYWVDTDFFPIDTTFYAVPEDGVPAIVAYLTLDGIDFSEMNSDSAVPGLNRNAALSKAVPLLRKAAMDHLAEVTQPLVTLAKCLAAESGTLQEIRDALLPKLMSGELRVANNDTKTFSEVGS